MCILSGKIAQIRQIYITAMFFARCIAFPPEITFSHEDFRAWNAAYISRGTSAGLQTFANARRVHTSIVVLQLNLRLCGGVLHGPGLFRLFPVAQVQDLGPKISNAEEAPSSTPSVAGLEEKARWPSWPPQVEAGEGPQRFNPRGPIYSGRARLRAQ